MVVVARFQHTHISTQTQDPERDGEVHGERGSTRKGGGAFLGMHVGAEIAAGKLKERLPVLARRPRAKKSRYIYSVTSRDK